MGNLRKVTIVVALGAFVLVAVWGISLLGSEKEDETMGLTNDGIVPDVGIPAIDAAAPASAETATFALG